MKKRIFAILMAIVLAIPMIAVFTVEAAAKPTRVINLVYDDSMSMIRLDETKEYVDTWSQARYAMETFAAMLVEGDTLNLYYMSKNTGTDNYGAEKPAIVGSADSKTIQDNVKRIHTTKTTAGNTPFEAVEQAYDDLTKTSAEEKWLVILTDGVLEAKGQKMTTDAVEKKLNSYNKNGIKVMYLAMGEYAEALSGNKESGFYCKKAKNSSEIRKELTDACNIIFQRNTLKSSFFNGKKFNFDVPMSQLIVFAQGENINIKSIIAPDGTAISPSSSVTVETAKKSYATTENYGTWIEIDKILEPEKMSGSVATFDAPQGQVFDAGEYTIDVSGTDINIEVYYMPEIDIQVFLYDGDVQVDAENIVEGKYTLEFGFVDKKGNPLQASELLGDPVFQASYVNTPKGREPSAPVPVQGGVPVLLEEGSVKFTVDVTYLEFIKHAELNYEVYFDGGLTYIFAEKPVYTLTTKGMTNEELPMVLTVQLNSNETLQPLNEIQWAEIQDPQINIDGDFGQTRIEKTEAIGVYNVYISMKDGDPFATSDGQIPITVRGSFESGLSKASGKLEDTFNVNTEITSQDRLLNWLEENWIKLVISLGILAVLLGYVPGIKKYLPKRLKKRPTINCAAESVMGQDMVAHGKYSKDTIKTLIPYIPETGSITVSPSPVKKTLRVRAKGGGMMYVTNVKSFAGKDNVLFGGTPVDKDTKKITISAGEMITVLSPEFTYTCTPNQ